jgi:Luciferase-like monooxygenase
MTSSTERLTEDGSSRSLRAVITSRSRTELTRVGENGLMADVGLVGGLGAWDDADFVTSMHEVLDSLPPQFPTLWGSDHLQQDGAPWPGEAWTTMTYLAAAFPRFRAGHLVLAQSYRNPALLAAMASTLQRPSGGRFILGLGAGWLEEENNA